MVCCAYLQSTSIYRHSLDTAVRAGQLVQFIIDDMKLPICTQLINTTVIIEELRQLQGDFNERHTMLFPLICHFHAYVPDYTCPRYISLNHSYTGPCDHPRVDVWNYMHDRDHSALCLLKSMKRALENISTLLADRAVAAQSKTFFRDQDHMSQD